MDIEGHIVEYVDSGALHLGFVRRREHRKVRVIDPRGRQSSIPASRILVVHGPVNEDDFPSQAERLVGSISELASEIDVELLWESVNSVHDDCSVGDLATRYFGEPSPERESAVYRALEPVDLLFRRRGMGFLPRSAEEVATERLRREREREKDAFRNHAMDLLRRALAGEPSDDPAWAGLVEQLERWLRQREPNPVGRLFEEITGENQARETAYDLLVRLGRIELDEDRFLLIRGIPTEFPEDVVRAAERLHAPARNASREDWTAVDAIAIDDRHTVEVDDAVTLVERGDHTEVGIHIADVAAFVEKGSALDREALRRTATVYLPNVLVPMFPHRLSTELASLVAGDPRPALSVIARFDERDHFVGARIARTTVSVHRRLTYAEADGALEAGDPRLARLRRITDRLCNERTAAGAQVHRRPEIKVHVTDGTIEVERIESATPSRLIVAELMILANRVTADRASADRIPIIYRTQDAPDSEPPDTDGLPEALRFEMLRRAFKRSHLSLSPAPHAGLGLDAYTQMSSPIRRYADLVTERQFTAAMEGRPLPYDNDELLRVIAAAEAREIEIRQLEQASTTYWILRYLEKQKLGTVVSAMLLDHKGHVELNDYLVRGKIPASEERHPGEVVPVMVESVRPIRGEIQLRVET